MYSEYKKGILQKAKTALHHWMISPWGSNSLLYIRPFKGSLAKEDHLKLPYAARCICSNHITFICCESFYTTFNIDHKIAFVLCHAYFDPVFRSHLWYLS